jgi:hypothetical protein
MEVGFAKGPVVVVVAVVVLGMAVELDDKDAEVDDAALVYASVERMEAIE